MLTCFRPFNPEQIDDILCNKRNFEKLVKSKWDTLKLDALICPTNYHSAFKIKDVSDLGTMVDYFCIWNLLNYPAGVVPVTTV